MRNIKLILFLSLATSFVFASVNIFPAFFSQISCNNTDTISDYKFQEFVNKYQGMVDQYNEAVFDADQFIYDPKKDSINILALKTQADKKLKLYKDNIASDTLTKQFKAVTDSSNKSKFNFSKLNEAIINEYITTKNENVVFSQIKSGQKVVLNNKDSSAINKVLNSISSIYQSYVISSQSYTNAIRQDSLSHKKYKLSLHLKDSLSKVYENDFLPAIDNYLSADTPILSQTFIYGGKKYFKIIISGNNLFDVRISSSNAKEKGRTLKSYWDRLIKNNEQPIFMMNAGMYNENYEAQGLMIENGKTLFPIDSYNKQRDGNFYMYPNGVFYIDSANGKISYGIKETQSYLKTAGKTVKYATQSGPMLVHENKIHKMFNPKSKNTNIRNGVGVYSDKKGNQKLVFLYSEVPVTFHEMATVFKDFLLCKEALYLDGTISQYFYTYKGKTSGELDNSRRLGPIVTILLNKKTKNTPQPRKP